MTIMNTPQFLVVGGANGSGKSTSAPAVLPHLLPYINADEIAKTLSAETGAARDIRAGRLLLAEWHRMEALRADFAIETTLASHALAIRVARLQEAGYQFHLLFFWLSSADLALARVAERVRQGGHDIPENTIRRRYHAGLRNFFLVYQPMADTWRVFDNSRMGETHLVVTGQRGEVRTVHESITWEKMKEKSANE
jgi:predicted ABC-type ATPase